MGRSQQLGVCLPTHSQHGHLWLYSRKPGMVFKLLQPKTYKLSIFFLFSFQPCNAMVRSTQGYEQGDESCLSQKNKVHQFVHILGWSKHCQALSLSLYDTTTSHHDHFPSHSVTLLLAPVWSNKPCHDQHPLKNNLQSQPHPSLGATLVKQLQPRFSNMLPRYATVFFLV